MRTVRCVWAAACFASALGACGVASADVPPPPTRPGWHEHDPPEPDVPEELTRALGALSLLALGGAAVRSRRARRSVEPART